MTDNSTKPEAKARGYEDVACDVGLDAETAARFIGYMTARWPKPTDEARMSCDGYAAEWAQRFAAGIEYDASDYHGRAILDDLAKAEGRST